MCALLLLCVYVCVDTSFPRSVWVCDSLSLPSTLSAYNVFFSFSYRLFLFRFVFGGTGESFRWFISGFSFGLIERKQILPTYGIVFRYCTNRLTHRGL